jgi:glutamate racemase
VVACNAAASTALDSARRTYDVPIVSVIEPGVRAAVAATRNGRVAVIGTQVTVSSGAYDNVLSTMAADVELTSQACPRFVDFVERGDTTSDELVAVAEEYLAPLRERRVDTVILGCTHYPLLAGVIQYVMGDGVVLVSSAEATATEVYARLRDEGLLNPRTAAGTHRFVASSEGTFSELGARFLGPEFGRVEYRPWDRT